MRLGRTSNQVGLYFRAAMRAMANAGRRSAGDSIYDEIERETGGRSRSKYYRTPADGSPAWRRRKARGQT